MRIAFLFDPKMVRLPFDVRALWTSPRGLTGSEVTFFRMAAEMVKRGHSVDLFSKLVEGGVIWNGVRCWTYQDDLTLDYDAAVSYISADPLADVSVLAFRIVHQQCRGWSMSKQGWDENVDLICALSTKHAVNLADSNLDLPKFRLLPDGVDLDAFKPVAKQPGRVIYASSPERGLHRLLECWPRIRAEAKHAHLRVFYDQHSLDHAGDDETRRRAAYIKAALPRLVRHGVEVIGGASRERIEREMAEAEVLAYPLESKELTETFGCVVLEAMASGCVPVLCFDDAFGELWGDCAVCVEAPIGEHLDEFVEKVVRVLNDATVRIDRMIRCRTRAMRYSWPVLAYGLEKAIETRGERWLAIPDWDGTRVRETAV